MVQVVCAVPAQDDMTCTVSPQDVAPNATVTFTVQTFATGNATAAGHRPIPSGHARREARLWLRWRSSCCLRCGGGRTGCWARRRAERWSFCCCWWAWGARAWAVTAQPRRFRRNATGSGGSDHHRIANVNNAVTSQNLTLPVNVVKK